MSESSSGPLPPEHFELLVPARLWHKTLKALEKGGLKATDITAIMQQGEDFDPRVRTFMVDRPDLKRG